jgi:hypothetical protein
MRRHLLCALVLLAGVGPALGQDPLPPGTTPLAPSQLPSALPASEAVDAPPPEAVPDAGTAGAQLPPAGFWITGSYLHWWVRHDNPPNLISLGSSSDTVPGALGQPGTVPGWANPEDIQGRPGMRFNTGVALERLGGLSLEADFLYLPEQATRFQVPNRSGQLIARPFVNGQSDAESAEQVVIPGTQTGTVLPETGMNLVGGEVNLRYPLWRGPVWNLSILGGFRSLRLHDDLGVFESSIAPGSDPTVRAIVIDRNDTFDSVNVFVGGQLGLDLAYVRDRFLVDVYGKLAGGSTDQIVDIGGHTLTSNENGAPFMVSSGGFLALPTNSGHFHDVRASLVPEFGFRLGYRLGEHWQVGAGYTLLWWNDVARANDQVDRVINPSQLNFTGTPGTLSGPSRPVFFFSQSEFLAQGVTFSIEYHY